MDVCYGWWQWGESGEGGACGKEGGVECLQEDVFFVIGCLCERVLV